MNSSQGPAPEKGSPISARSLFIFLPFFLFFVSSLCGLVYEVVWSRMLVLVMGNTTLATSTILASFMAGLSLGSYYWGHHVESSSRRPLFLFGCLEAGTGLTAIIFSKIIPVILPLETLISQIAGLGVSAQVMLRFFSCFCVLICPTFLMGGTLAVIGRHVISQRQSIGRNTAILYSINTAGSLMGAFLAGFFLIRFLGHDGTLILVAFLNLVIGITAVLLDARLRRNGAFVDRGEEKQWINERAVIKPSTNATHLVFIGLGLSGFCGMAYQVLWTRLLILIIDNSVYSFTIILMAVLAGISLGSLSLAPVFRSLKNPVLLFGLVEIGIAISAFFFPFFIHLRPKDPNASYLRFLFLTLPIGMLVPTVLMGMAFPLAAQIYHLRKCAVGKSLGTVFAINTGGSVLGVLAACFIFIGQLGFQKSALILPGINLAIGVLIAATQLRPNPRYAFAGAMILLAIIGTQIMPFDYFSNKYGGLEPKSNLIYYKESIATTATVFERPDKTRVLYLNGIPEVDTGLLSIKTFKLMGALPGLLHHRPKNALMVTFGAGVAAGITSHFVDHLDCVDLAAQAREIAPYFEFFNDRIIENDKISLHIDDARHFLQNSRSQYSIIISDATHPRVYDSWVLFTTEFYQLVQNRLAKDGIFLQWLPFHGLDLKQYLGIVNTFSNVFQHTSIWCIGQDYSLLLSTPQPLRIDFRAFQKKLFQKDIQKSMRQADLDNPFVVLTCFALGEKKIKEMLSDFPMLMTDDSPAHLFFPFRTTFEEQYAKWPEVNYQKIHAYEESVIPFLNNISDSKRESSKIISKIRYYESCMNR